MRKQAQKGEVRKAGKKQIWGLNPGGGFPRGVGLQSPLVCRRSGCFHWGVSPACPGNPCPRLGDSIGHQVSLANLGGLSLTGPVLGARLYLLPRFSHGVEGCQQGLSGPRTDRGLQRQWVGPARRSLMCDNCAQQGEGFQGPGADPGSMVGFAL